MKKLLTIALAGVALLTAAGAQAQADKSKRTSPPAVASETINTGAVVTINYSQPSVKGRTPGKDVEPMQGKVWRMGANEATTFEVSKDVTINGKHKLPAGKYSLFGLAGEKDFTLIFNPEWKIWGTQYEQHKDKDVLRVAVRPATAPTSAEQLTYSIDKEGHIILNWGTWTIDFYVQ